MDSSHHSITALAPSSTSNLLFFYYNYSVFMMVVFFFILHIAVSTVDNVLMAAYAFLHMTHATVL